MSQVMVREEVIIGCSSTMWQWTLNDIGQGQEATILRLRGNGAIRQRLMDMGMMRGVRVRVERRAPLGDPIAIRLKGYFLAIRSDEARLIEVEPVRNEETS